MRTETVINEIYTNLSTLAMHLGKDELALVREITHDLDKIGLRQLVEDRAARGRQISRQQCQIHAQRERVRQLQRRADNFLAATVALAQRLKVVVDDAHAS